MSDLTLDSKFPRHLKVEPLSDAAFRLHVHALAHCAEQETDGFIAERSLEGLSKHRSKAKLVTELTSARSRTDGRPLWIDVDGGWLINNFLDWNESHEQAELRREIIRKRSRAATIRHLIIRRDGLTCGICGRAVERADVHVDHIVALAKGGESVPTNLRVTHARCNLKKGNR